MFFTKWFNKKPIRKSRFQTTLDILNSLLQKQDFKYLYSSDYKLIIINSLYKNLLEYNNVLEDIIPSLEKDLVIKRNLLSVDNYSTTVHEFLLDKNKRYIDINEYFPKFCENSIKLIELYEDRETELNQSAELSRNIYLCQYIVLNLTSIIKGFEDE